MTVLVTGAAGFIGFHVSTALLARGDQVIGVDNLNAYYDVGLKQARLDLLVGSPRFQFIKADISDHDQMLALTAEREDITGVVHFAAQAGVRHSLVDPYAYVQANVMGQVVMLEMARRMTRLNHFVYASSSSVYGGNTDMPFSIDDRVDRPNSLYAATKRADELIAGAYAHLYGLPCTGLRLFTVYGPWGRPDMAPILFARAIMAGEPITVFNQGEMSRDFTFIDDIVEGVLRALDRPASGAPPHALYNLGTHKAEKLLDFIAALEKALGRKARLKFAPMQPGDVPATYADIDASRRDLGFQPKTPISAGIPKFVEWCAAYYAA